LKPVVLRPQARIDLQAEVRYYRIAAGKAVARKLAMAHQEALVTLQQQPGIGSPRVGELVEIHKIKGARLELGQPPG
jgi:toxin ParE1/3/4